MSTRLGMDDTEQIYVRPANSKYIKYGRPRNDILLRVIENKDEEVKKDIGNIPFWIMRQAGRYLPEYMEIRKKYSFIEICNNPELSSEVSIMPFKRFGCDMVVIFSDILIIFVAMGIDLKFVDNIGPILNKEIYNMNDFQKLNVDVKKVINNMYYVYDSINITKGKLNNDVPILGFVGSPFTLFTYLTKNNKKTYEHSLKFIYEHKTDTHTILNVLSNICINHLINQIDSGANVIQIFDSNADIVSKNMYKEFSLYYLKKVINIVKKNRPDVFIILFIKDNFHEDIKNLHIDVLSITHKQLEEKTSSFYYNLFQNKIIIQGALDPHILLIDDMNLVQKYTSKMLDQIVHKNKYIANLGHGILPNSKIDNVHAFIQTIRGVKNRLPLESG
ncbi:uroporphyrinogen III decarboxylase, putative [Plasmodium ovale]|uniref:uroporphyrinogen decarboxylase n=1 Tax=Plasmodium ovale TaxID=36330 RepID=A0A1D3TJP6_PLAOA|nr:uroporphyrinogen III decarboxylase, putative [Plasmodium ovale]